MPDYITELGTDLLTEWDARDIGGLANNDPISSWPKTSYSTEGNNLAQATGARQPLYKTGTYPYAQYDGTDDVLSCNLVTDPAVIFIVLEATIDATTRAIYSCLSGGNYHWAYIAGTTLTNAFAGTTPARSPATFWTSALDAVRLVFAVRVTSAAIGHYTATIAKLDPITARPSFAGAITVGGFNAGISYPWSGKIHHVLTCKTLTQEKIFRVMAQLRSEWGITGDVPLAGGTGGGDALIDFVNARRAQSLLHGRIR